jgi:hypothetical protein
VEPVEEFDATGEVEEREAVEGAGAVSDGADFERAGVVETKVAESCGSAATARSGKVNRRREPSVVSPAVLVFTVTAGQPGPGFVRAEAEGDDHRTKCCIEPPSVRRV